MKTTQKTRPGNVTPFVLEGCWALDRLDQPTMRWLSKVAKRNHAGVADVIYEALEAFVAKCEAEAELENKIIKFDAGSGDALKRNAFAPGTLTGRF